MEPTALSQLRKGCYDVHARIDDMNVNGVLGSLCFGSVPGFCGELFAREDDKDLARAMIQAYNDWHIDEWCGAHPGRFIPLALPMLWDPKLMADEVHRVADKGCHAMTFPDTPKGLGFPSLHDACWEPFWQACNDTGTVVCMHIGSGTGMKLEDPAAPVEIMITGAPISLFSAATELVFSDFLRKYGDLKIALSEGGIGWIPYFLERCDYVYEHHSAWTHQDFGPGKKPSDVFREHVVTCFIDDDAGVRNRDLIGIDNLTWECDYPHSDCTWPKAPETLWRSMKDLPREEVDKITHLNVMKHFQYDPFQHVPREEATVGALRARAQHVDLTLKARQRRQAAERLREGLRHHRRHHEADVRRLLGGLGHLEGVGRRRSSALTHGGARSRAGNPMARVGLPDRHALVRSRDAAYSPPAPSSLRRLALLAPEPERLLAQRARRRRGRHRRRRRRLPRDPGRAPDRQRRLLRCRTGPGPRGRCHAGGFVVRGRRPLGRPALRREPPR